MREFRACAIVLWVLCVPPAVQAAMPSTAQIRAVANSYNAKHLAPAFGVSMTIAEAAKVQQRYNLLTERGKGKVVGYKAALTNPIVQKRFGYDKPLRGTLYAAMILSSPARVPAAYGSRPLYEADMVAVVGDAAKVMAATTPLEALQGLQEFRSFIELPDLVFDPGVQLDGPQLLAINAAARLGVLGAPIHLPASSESVQRLADMKVEVVDQTGAVRGGGKGSDTLGNPLNAVLWIADSLRSEGKTLKAGDLLSLGSFSALAPPKAGETITVRYVGLTADPAEASVTFE